MYLNKMFSSLDPVILYKRHAKKNINKIYGITFNKSYKDNVRKNILTKFKKRVIVFCLVRDPISIIKTHVHYHINSLLVDTVDSNRKPKISSENKKLINNKISNMISFLSDCIIKKSKITPFFCFTSLLQNIKNATKEALYIDTIRHKYKARLHTLL